MCFCLYKRYFNPLSRVGRDDKPYNVKRHNVNFNPLSRVGRDAAYDEERIIKIISIHSPAWGETFYQCFDHQLLDYFNPLSRVGRDTFKSSNMLRKYYFNPLSRVGRDSKNKQLFIVFLALLYYIFTKIFNIIFLIQLHIIFILE